MRPALTAKSGSRGKIQQRCCQGRIASAWSQRHTVLVLSVATSPLARAAAARSAAVQRARGAPDRVGNSHARALTWTTTSGGKTPGPPRAWPFRQAGEALVIEALAPQAHHFAPRV